jgi:hypothetical protein
MVTAIRLRALALGVSCAGLGAFGPYEFAHKLWLLPAALDPVAFMAICTALSGYGSGQARKPVAKRKPKGADAKAQAEALSRRTANDYTNVVPSNAA